MSGPNDDGSARDEDPRAELSEVVDELGFLAVGKASWKPHCLRHVLLCIRDGLTNRRLDRTYD